MLQEISTIFKDWNFPDVAAELAALAAYSMVVGIASWLVNFILKRYIVKIVARIARDSGTLWGKLLAEQGVFRRLSHLGPGLVIYAAMPLLISKHYEWITDIGAGIRTLAVIYMLFAIIFFLMSLIRTFDAFYTQTRYALERPIKGYLQILRIVVWCLAVVFAISILLDQSPWAFFTGLGAVSAVLLLVFKDTILGFVASIQVSAYDMVRVGDWITIPKLGANGDVIEVSINNVKVRNFDHTIVHIPTYSLISNGVQNWRGMSDSGGRRIKRSIYIDLDAVHFCSAAELESFKRFDLLKPYIETKQAEIADHNQALGIAQDSQQINGRSLTNVGLFRAYIEQYLRNRQDIHQEFTFIIRQLQPTELGLPVQVYVFTNDVNWGNYERIQSDVFDHLLAALPGFGLRAFQLLSSQSTVGKTLHA